MLHFLTAGHLDVDAVRQGRLEVRAPLDPGLVAELLVRFCGSGTAGDAALERSKVEWDRGTVRLPWYSPRLNPASVKLALALQQATGCTIADVEHGRVVTGQELKQLL
jgi:hypothetical protein